MATNSAGLIGALTGMVSQIKTNILKKFRAFYLKRVHEVDLAPTKTFSYDFEISTAGSSHRRSVSKLKALVAKYILKNTPAVALADREFIPLDTSTNIIKLELFNIEIGQTMPQVNKKIFRENLAANRVGIKDISNFTYEEAKQNERIARSILTSTVQYLQIQRYLKYLQYLVRKSGIPVILHVGFNLSENNTVLRYQVYVTVAFGIWIPVTTDGTRRLEAVQAGATDDALFSEGNLWHYSEDSYSVRKNIVRFFIHLDKALQVVNTLTRKIDYGYNAFNFRTA